LIHFLWRRLVATFGADLGILQSSLSDQVV